MTIIIAVQFQFFLTIPLNNFIAPKIDITKNDTKI